MVPNGWSIQKLEQIATVERGKFSARPRNDPKYFGGNIPFVQTGDIAAAKTYLQNYTQTLNEDGLKVSRLFPKDTILITIAANIGDTAITSFDVACPDSLVAIRTNKDTDCFWLKLYLETCKDELDGKATQNAQKNINLQVLKPLEVLTPPYPEQRKIAQILSTWDRGIATTEKLIDASKQQKKALMQQLLTGKKRLVDPETGKVFEGEWEEVTFDHALSKLTDYTANGSFAALADNVSVYDESNYALWIMGRTLKSGNFVKDVRYTDKHGYDFLKKTKLFGGELLMPKTGDVGKAYLFPKLDQKATLADNVFLLDFKDFIINEYARYYINSEYFQFELERTMYGTSQKTIVKKALRKMKIILPSILEQNLIVTVLDKADKEIELLETKLAHFKQEKKALMQQLLTGKRRVKVAETEAA